jgi:hypothetical protein
MVNGLSKATSHDLFIFVDSNGMNHLTVMCRNRIIDIQKSRQLLKNESACKLSYMQF